MQKDTPTPTLTSLLTAAHERHVQQSQQRADELKPKPNVAFQADGQSDSEPVKGNRKPQARTQLSTSAPTGAFFPEHLSSNQPAKRKNKKKQGKASDGDGDKSRQESPLQRRSSDGSKVKLESSNVERAEKNKSQGKHNKKKAEVEKDDAVLQGMNTLSINKIADSSNGSHPTPGPSSSSDISKGERSKDNCRNNHRRSKGGPQSDSNRKYGQQAQPEYKILQRPKSLHDSAPQEEVAKPTKDQTRKRSKSVSSTDVMSSSIAIAKDKADVVAGNHGVSGEIKYAGPMFQNSPDASSLPIPAFNPGTQASQNGVVPVRSGPVTLHSANSSDWDHLKTQSQPRHVYPMTSGPHSGHGREFAQPPVYPSRPSTTTPLTGGQSGSSDIIFRLDDVPDHRGNSSQYPSRPVSKQSKQLLSQLPLHPVGNTSYAPPAFRQANLPSSSSFDSFLRLQYNSSPQSHPGHVIPPYHGHHPAIPVNHQAHPGHPMDGQSYGRTVMPS
ncbi:hypothetical protein BZG36_05313 [Bifiguratus adelaidae]|uniref:Uncharacterized protein n=1 Tax=Bifiguratus adelaidae TaxID=1938954 RepID=A0A261XTM4_9FUNG|nr:hypothetical protein BZG36_05313 [Bifiguratus adelaidae]